MKKHCVFMNAAKTQYFGLAKDGQWIPVTDKSRAWVINYSPNTKPNTVRWLGQVWTACEVGSDFSKNPGYSC